MRTKCSDNWWTETSRGSKHHCLGYYHLNIIEQHIANILLPSSDGSNPSGSSFLVSVLDKFRAGFLLAVVSRVSSDKKILRFDSVAIFIVWMFCLHISRFSLSLNLHKILRSISIYNPLRMEQCNKCIFVTIIIFYISTWHLGYSE